MNIEQLPIIIRRHARAKRMTMRLSPAGDEIRLTIPKRMSEKRAMGFISEQREWLERQHEGKLSRVPFEPKITIPLFGLQCHLVHDASLRGAAYQEDSETKTSMLTLGGDLRYFPRRVEDWVRKEAKRRYSEDATRIAAAIGERPSSISIRDTSSRWGSCSRTRRISLSWRLAFAPAYVAHYVIAHEVAHLKHFDHSPAFWACVAELDPETEIAKRWLKQYGQSLHRYGRA